MRELYARALLSLILAVRWAMAPARRLEADRLALRQAEYDAQYKLLYDQAYAKQDPGEVPRMDESLAVAYPGGNVEAGLSYIRSYNNHMRRHWAGLASAAEDQAHKVAIERLGGRPC